MRVATRRMRAAWRVFDGAYRPKLQRRYVRRAARHRPRPRRGPRPRRPARAPRRLRRARCPRPGREAMEPLRGAWRRQRETRAGPPRDAPRLAAVPRVRRRLPRLHRVAGRRRRCPRAMGQPSLVRDTAGSRILAAYEHVRAYETIITWADVPDPARPAHRDQAAALRARVLRRGPAGRRRAQLIATRHRACRTTWASCNDADVAATHHARLAERERATAAGRVARGGGPLPRFARGRRGAPAAQLPAALAAHHRPRVPARPGSRDHTDRLSACAAAVTGGAGRPAARRLRCRLRRRARWLGRAAARGGVFAGRRPSEAAVPPRR